MSLTSYRAAPPRAKAFSRLKRRRGHPPAWLSSHKLGRPFGLAEPSAPVTKNIANGFCSTPPAKPGDDLLFHCLGNSTIGAVRFHGRVRDGIGWVTDAMITKLW